MKRWSLLLLLSILIPQSVYAQVNQISVTNDRASLAFPDDITFSATFKAEDDITNIRLIYGTTQDSCGNVVAIAFPEFTPGKKVITEWTWDMRKSGGEPPGAEIWWQWEARDTIGNTTLTERQTITWLDDKHNWKTLNEGMIRLHYYSGSSNFGNTLKSTAVNALSRLSKDTGLNATEPIDLYIYANTADMRDAVLYEPGWTGGLAYPENNIVIIGIAPEELEWGKRTEAHELTHVLVGDYTFSCLGAMPTWMVEGLAVYGEGAPEPSEATNFAKRVQNNSLLSFRVLSGGFSEDPDKADLSYSQSYYMVNYLIEQYGKEKLIDLLTLLKSGGELNASLQSNYGFDLTGFENEWRLSLGLTGVEEERTAATATPTIVPTFVPMAGILPAATLTPRQPVSPTITAAPSQVAATGKLDDLMNDSTLKNAVIISTVCVCASLLLVVVIVIIVLVRQAKARTGKEQGGAP